MGKFSDLNNKSSGGNRNYFFPGTYLAEILSMKHIEKGFKGESMIVEFEIKEVLLHKNAETRTNSNGQEIKFESSRRVGDKVSSVFKLDGPNKDMALGNLADYMRALIATQNAIDGSPVESLRDVHIPDGAVEEAFGVDQPAVGMTLMVECQGTITVAKQQAFTQVVYRVPPADKLQAAAA
jgi:hypothetical protein